MESTAGVREDVPPRRRRSHGARPAAVAALIAIAVALVGCSAGGAGSGGSVVQPGAGAGAEGVGAEDAGAAAEDDRSVIIEGSMSIVAADVDEAAAAALDIVRDAGGRVDGREEWSDQSDEGARMTATMVLRIPADSLETALDALRDLGTVESLRTSTVDVTTEVQDVDARVAALQSTIARLESFQEGVASVDDLLSIEEEISQRQTELETYLARQADLGEQVAFSTVTLSIQSQPSPSTAPDSFWGGLIVGWTSFVTFLAGFAIVLGVLLPWLLALGLLAAAIVALVRWVRRRRPPEPPAEPRSEPPLPWIQDDERRPVRTGGTPPTA
ncbi:DUF4349 domain-containing protein [Microbacterium cremeum]|uniref:DUF4349 domain-containing protein n=1 Tax=Microbacterium cremeum TaxID=2782169 RepID=UPI001886CA6B|nr:DUF4349 domain-containing protein [Microbacterium cremeum]